MQPIGVGKQLSNESKRDRESLESREDVDLKKLWDDAKAKFAKETGQSLDEDGLSSALSKRVQEMLHVEGPNEADIDEDEHIGFFNKAAFKKGFRRAQDLFKKMFEVIWKFKEFLLPMATSIPLFGAGITFVTKAIELLIQTTQNYRAIFIKAGELFDQVGFFSMRFEMLMEAENTGAKINRKYLQFLNLILAHTVHCAALFIKLTKQSEEAGFLGRAKNAGKVTKQFLKTMASGDDAGVGSHMTTLQSLVKQEGKLSTALILASVLKIQTDVTAISGKLDTVLGSSKTEQLKAMLCITSEPWNSRLRACAEGRIRGTGDWLSQHDLFTAWVTNPVDSPQILAIEAGSKCGKTHLATAATIYLREQAKQGQALFAVATYLFDQSSKKLTAGDIVRSIAYQLCIQNRQFFEKAYPAIQQTAGKNETIELLWSTLIVDVASRIAGLTCFVVFDGVEHIDERNFEVFCKALTSSATATRALRILFTGNASRLAVVTERSGLLLGKIALDEPLPNQKDVELVTEAYVADCYLFSRTSSKALLEYKSKICDRLVRTVSGDFYLLESRIGEIRHLQSQGEIQRVLDRAEQRSQDIIRYQLSSLAIRLSNQELSDLKSTLHLLAVLEKAGAQMPHVSVVELYLTGGDFSSGLIMTNIQSAYSSLLSINDEGYLSLATPEITSHLIAASKQSEGMNPLPQFSQTKQLGAIQHFLTSTFTPQALQTDGFDDEFFESRSRLSKLSQFSVEIDPLIATVVIRLVDCLDATLESIKEGDNEKKERARNLVSFTQGVLQGLFLLVDNTKLDEDRTTYLGIAVARLFLEKKLLDVFWPVEALPQVRATWLAENRYFDAVLRLIKHPSVTKYVETQPQKYSWARSLQEISNADHLKLYASRMVATRWFQSKSFWTYNEIMQMFLWFTAVPILDLRYENEDEDADEDEDENGWEYEDDAYDYTRMIGWYTPPNWRKIEAWVLDNIQIDDQADLDIQTAAILCSFGGADDCGQHKHRTGLLSKHCETDWRAMVWLAEATSYSDKFDEAFGRIEQALDLMNKYKPDYKLANKAIDDMLHWMGSWQNLYKNMDMRQKMLALNETIPGAVSHQMISQTLGIAILTKDKKEGFEFFRSFYCTGPNIVIEIFVHQALDNNTHSVLSRMIADDADGSRISLLCDMYQKSIALCESTRTLSRQEKKTKSRRLVFWLGRLHFISKDHSKLQEAITIWEDLIEDFLSNPTVADVEDILPIVTHLGSAYLQKVLKDPASADVEPIISKVKVLRERAGFSQEPLPLKLRFRLSVCLARIYIAARDNSAEARDVLSEHAASSFAMIFERQNKPLSSIGWQYLASILTVLGQDGAERAWTKIEPHQPDNWDSNRWYTRASGSDADSKLDADLKVKLDAIKKGEEFDFWVGMDGNNITSHPPDRYYLPSYTSMGCDGRNCRSTSNDRSERLDSDCNGLQVPVEYGNRTGHFVPAQNALGRGQKNDHWQRISYWVCRDCVSCKLCVTCRKSLLDGDLPPMGCKSDHDGVTVPQSDGDGDPYAVTDEDIAWVLEESKRWNVSS